MAQKRLAGEKRRIVILGGGFGGAYAAQTLHSRLGGDAEVVLIDRNNYILFYPLLIEAGVGAIEGRHVVIPIRQFIPKGEFRMAEVLGADLERQQVTYQVIGEDRHESLQYDHLVFALGSVTRMPNVPGLREHGYQLKSLTDALELRDRAIRLLELANTVKDSEKRREILRFVVVGGNFSGVEFAGEYHAFLMRAKKSYRHVRKDEIQVMLLEYGERILPATSANLSAYASEVLRKRGVDVRARSTLTEIGERHAVLLDGQRVATRTVVWTAGIEPSPLIGPMGLPVNEHGYIECEQDLRVKGYDNVWAIGDAATVLDKSGKPYAPTAQNASRQGPLVARNILASLKDEPLEAYRFNPLGAFAVLGRRKAVANVMGRDVKGLLAWFMYRTTYLLKMPTLGRKMRLGADWFLDFLLPPAPVQLGIGRRNRGTLDGNNAEDVPIAERIALK